LSGVWCAGDLAGVAQTTVEATNDGKVAAWDIHRHLQNQAGIVLNGDQANLPGFHCDIDEVDLSVDICGKCLRMASFNTNCNFLCFSNILFIWCY
jgi:dihydropyrimidine dehydrogenase (NADP+)